MITRRDFLHAILALPFLARILPAVKVWRSRRRRPADRYVRPVITWKPGQMPQYTAKLQTSADGITWHDGAGGPDDFGIRVIVTKL